MSQGVHVLGGKYPRGKCPGGKGVSVQGVCVLGVCVLGVCVLWVHVRGEGGKYVLDLMCNFCIQLVFLKLKCLKTKVRERHRNI